MESGSAGLFVLRKAVRPRHACPGSWSNEEVGPKPPESEAFGSLRTMDGWQILAFYLLAWAVALVSPFLRKRLLLVPGSNFVSAHLLLMAALLTEAALSRDGTQGLGGPLGVAGLLAAASVFLRDVWLLVGR